MVPTAPTLHPTPEPTLQACANGVKDGNETDVDCGGDCKSCSIGASCLTWSDCSSKVCTSSSTGLPCTSSDSVCTCSTTPSPTPEPTATPTFSPPEVIRISSNVNTSQVATSSKLILTAVYTSTDPHVKFLWSVVTDDPYFTLQYGVTTSTPLTNSILVVKAYTLLQGYSYSFSVTAINSYNHGDIRELNVTAARSPYNGTLDVSPLNGTALVTPFVMRTYGWLDDADSYPLTSAFIYVQSDGSTAYLDAGTERELSDEQSTGVSNFTLPIGFDDEYHIIVGVLVSDVVGASTTLNLTVQSFPPSLDAAEGLISNSVNDIDKAVLSGDTGSASQLVQSSASVLNYLMQSSADKSSASSLRSSLINSTLSLVSASSTLSNSLVESQLVATSLLSKVSPKLLSASDQSRCVSMVSSLVSRSKSLGSATSTSTSSSMSTLSNVLAGDYLNPSSASSDASEAASASRVAKLESTLLTLNSVIGSNLAVGEDADTITTDQLAMSSSRIDSDLLSLNGV